MIDFVAQQYAILQLADEVMPDVELEQSITEQRVVDSRSEFPAALGFQVGVAGVDAVGSQIPKADKVIEVELGNGPANR